MSASKSFLVSTARLAGHRLRLPAVSPPALLGHRASSTSASEPSSPAGDASDSTAAARRTARLLPAEHGKNDEHSTDHSSDRKQRTYLPYFSNAFTSEEANTEEYATLLDDKDKPPPPHLSSRARSYGKSKSVDDNSRHIPDPDSPLPAPPMPSRYPSPMLNNADIEMYLTPLYHRNWSYHFHTLEDLRLAPALRKLYTFPDDGAALDFVTKLSQHANTVKHHPVIRFCNKEVFVFLFTHAAYLPVESELAAQSAAIGEQVRKPGVTYHDVRLAYRAEGLFKEMRAQTGFSAHNQVRPFAERPRSVRELLTQFRAIVEKRSMRHEAEREAHRIAYERRRWRADGQRGDKRARYVKPGDEERSGRSGVSDSLTLLRTLQKIRNSPFNTD